MDKYGLKSVSVCLSVLRTHRDVAPTDKRRSAWLCHGFTLIEIMISLFVVLTLTAIAVPLTADYIQQAKVARAIVEIRTLEKEILIFEMENDYYPGGKQPIISFMLQSLQEIGRDQFCDPWGTPYQYRNLAQGPKGGNDKPLHCRKDRMNNPLNYDFDLYSVGPDREVPTIVQIGAGKGEDDIVRAANGRYVGEGGKY